MMIDHTFTFPRMIWTFATVVLIAFGYSSLILLLSYLLIYALYVVVAVVNFVSVSILLQPYPTEQRFYLRLWWVTLTLPVYMFICSWIRLIGIINAMTTKASWKMRGLSEEKNRLTAVIRDDVQTIRQRWRQARKARLAMKQRSYKIKSYVNASHAVRWESGTGKKHNHTWKIVCELHVFEGMVSFFEIEKSLNKAINALSGQYLNDLPEFQVINPTVENVTEYLFNEIDSILQQNNAVLLRIEVSDSPTRSYCIDITERQFPTEAEVLPDQSASQDDTDA